MSHFPRIIKCGSCFESSRLNEDTKIFGYNGYEVFQCLMSKVGRETNVMTSNNERKKLFFREFLI